MSSEERMKFILRVNCNIHKIPSDFLHLNQKTMLGIIKKRVVKCFRVGWPRRRVLISSPRERALTLVFPQRIDHSILLDTAY